MAYDMMSSAVIPTVRSDYDMPNPNAAIPYAYKSAFSFPGGGRAHSSLSIAEQAELEYELRYRGNMIVDQQRKIQQLEDELRQARDQVDMMNSQLTTYEQDRVKEKKKPQSRYWTPEEHQRFLEALQKYGHKDVKSISQHVSTRNATQVRTHAQKYFLRLERERRKKEENNPGSGDASYDSSGSMDDDFMDDDMSPHMTSIAGLLPGSPAVLLGDSMESPGTPGESSPSTTAPGSPTPGPLRPQVNRRRATSYLNPSVAAQHRESVLVGLPPSWSTEDYDQFMKGFLSMVDKYGPDDTQTLCRNIREQYLPHHTPEEVEMCHKNVVRLIKHKPIAASPKRRRTNSRPEPLSSSLGINSFAPSFPAPPVSSLSSSFPYRNTGHSPTSNHSPSQQQTYNSSPAHSPLTQPQSIHSPSSQVVRSSPFAEYGQVSSNIDFPLLADLNLNGVQMSNPPNPQHMGGPNMGGMQQQMAQQQHVQQQHVQQQMQQQGIIMSNQPHHHQQMNHNNPPMTPNTIWGSALPFSFDALMSGNVSLPQTMVTHN